MSIATTTMLATRRPLTRCLISRRKALSTNGARGVASSSSASGSQSSKICAVPFGLRPEDAMTRLHMTGLLASGKSILDLNGTNSAENCRSAVKYHICWTSASLRSWNIELCTGIRIGRERDDEGYEGCPVSYMAYRCYL